MQWYYLHVQQSSIHNLFTFTLTTLILCIQVAWLGREEVSATGVLEQCLSKEVIQEYETEIEAKVSVDKAVQIGQKTYTGTVTQRQLSLESAPRAKKSRLTKWSTPQTSG